MRHLPEQPGLQHVIGGQSALRRHAVGADEENVDVKFLRRLFHLGADEIVKIVNVDGPRQIQANLPGSSGARRAMTSERVTMVRLPLSNRGRATARAVSSTVVPESKKTVSPGWISAAAVRPMARLVVLFSSRRASKREGCPGRVTACAPPWNAFDQPRNFELFEVAPNAHLRDAELLRQRNDADVLTA